MREKIISTKGTSIDKRVSRPADPKPKMVGKGPAYDHDPFGRKTTRDSVGPAPWIKKGR